MSQDRAPYATGPVFVYAELALVEVSGAAPGSPWQGIVIWRRRGDPDGPAWAQYPHSALSSS